MIIYENMYLIKKLSSTFIDHDVIWYAYINCFHISLLKLVKEFLFFQPTFSDANVVNNMYLRLDTEIRKNDKMPPWIMKEKDPKKLRSILDQWLNIVNWILVNGRRNDCITLLFHRSCQPGLAVKKSQNYPTHIKVRKDMQMIFSIQKNSSFFVMIICYVFQGSISFFGIIGMYM